MKNLQCLVLISTITLTVCSHPSSAIQVKQEPRKTVQLASTTNLQRTTSNSEYSLDDVLHDLGVHKTNAQDFVRRAKKIKDEAKQEQAHRLYVTALAQYNAYIDGIARSVRRSGKADLKKYSQDAYDAGIAFEKYVDENENTAVKAIPAFIPVAQELARLAGIIVNKSKNNRDLLFDEVVKLKWEPWDKI